MTEDELRLECEVALNHFIDPLYTRQQNITYLMSLCKRQQAVGIKEVEQHCDDQADISSGIVAAVYMQVADWCLSQAQERER